MRCYDLFQKIDNESKLAEIFNQALKKMDLVRMTAAPRYFSDKRGAGLFYECCLWEMYLHSIIYRLEYWISTLEEYETEYMSSWEYYARSKRIDSIKEYGGDDDDYNPDGTIKTIGINNDTLKIYSVIDRLVFEDARDIVQDTEEAQIYGMINALQASASFSITDIFKGMGANIPSYHKDENGNMIKNTFADNVLHKATEQAFADNLGGVILFAHAETRSIIDNIRNFDKCQDNKEELAIIKRRALNLYNFNYRI